MKTTLLEIVAAAALLFAGCSNLVKADRSKVPDDLYHPTDAGPSGVGGAGGSAATDAGPDTGDAGDAAIVDARVEAGNEVGNEVGDAVDAPDASIPVDGAGADALSDVNLSDASTGDAADGG